ncbi:MAG: TIGR00159 family protein [Elusimicrobia bacterium]|nr:TIGR00159 family protein [Elusimicrobiota bacterium]
MSPRWAEIIRIFIDLCLASFLLYRVIVLIRGTKSMQVAIGLLVLMFLTYMVRMLNLTVTSWLLDQFWLAGILLLVVVFQPEIRDALADLGKSPLVAKVLFSEQVDFLTQIKKAVDDFSARKIGTLIVLEQEIGLKNYINTGISIDSRITKELLVAIFQPPSPLHDGAIIVSTDGRLLAAKCILPVTSSAEVSKAYGVRHHAAVGLAEVSDAIVIVVSEQTGQTAVARNGRLDPEVDVNQLFDELRILYQNKAKKSLLRAIESQTAGGRRNT